MVPPINQELVIVKLAYSTMVHPKCPRLVIKRLNSAPSVSNIEATEWYTTYLCQETSNLSQDCGLIYVEWRITSGDESLFRVNDDHYDNILMILGEEMTHWLFYGNAMFRRRIDGSALLPISYCSCCFHNQFIKIMDEIKRCESLRPLIAMPV